MSSIDNRIVQMQFDNRQFENGIRTSMRSLTDFERKLKMEGATKGLSDIEKTAKTFSMAGISSSVDAVANKFSALSVIAITALANITNSAVNAGKNMVSALTIDPITMGFDEYETKMGSIQTILTNTASKGTTLKDVNSALDELNEYSDKTIYNFSEMTKNIGTFTAAGVDLNTSTMAIKGIANLAAGSGSNALQASTAMYQLSQALAAGKVGLQDWNSVVNAGMGGELFQKALEKTAASLGKGRNMAVSFRESLESGWITTEVLTKTLKQFADDPALVKAATQVKTFTQLLDTMKESVQSGWAKTWEIIIGDKDESSKMLTSINDVFGALVGKSAEARNSMLAFWKANGGRDAMIQSVTNAFNGLMSVLQPIGEAFNNVFPAMTGQRLVELTKLVQDFTSHLKLDSIASNDLKNTFQGLFAVLDIVKQVVTSAGKAFFDLVGYVSPAGNSLLAFTGAIGLYLKNMDDTIKKTGVFNSIFSKVADVIKMAADAIGIAVSGIAKWISGVADISVDGISYFVEQVHTRFSPLKSLEGFLGDTLKGIAGLLAQLSPIFSGLAKIIGGALDDIRNNIAATVNGGDGKSLLDILNTGLFAGILIGIKKFIGALADIGSGAGGALGGLVDILDGVKGSLQAYQSSLKAGTLLKIATAIGILATSLLLLATIDADRLTSALKAISVMFFELFLAMAAFEKLSGGGLLTMSKLSIGMIGLSTAVLILSGAMTNIAKLNWDEIGKGLAGVGGIMAELALFMKVTNFNGMGVSAGLGIIALAEGVKILGDAVQIFGGMDTNAMIQGLLGVAAVLAEISIFVNTTGNAKKVISTATGVMLLGAAMLIFAEAIKKMGNLSWEEIGKGLLTMAASLTVVAGSVAIMPKTGMVSIGVGLVGIATALVILSTALKSMGGMSWEEIAKGLVTLAGALIIIAPAMVLMEGTLSGAAALLVVSGALAILAPVLKLLASMSLSEIGTSLITLAGALTVLGITSSILAPLAPAMLEVSIAVALFGVGCLAAGAGVLALSAGIAALAVSGAAGAASLVLIISSVVDTLPTIATSLAESITKFIQVIDKNAPTIAKSIADILLVVITTIVNTIPKIQSALLGLLVKMMETFASYIPQLMKAGADIIVAFLNGIAEQLPRVVLAAINLIVTFINALADGLRDSTDKLVGAITNLMTAVVEVGFKLLMGSVTKFLSAGSQIMNSGFITGIKDEIANYLSTLGDMISSGVTCFMDSISKFLSAGSSIMSNGLIAGVASKIGNFVSGLSAVINAGLTKLGSHVSEFFESGVNMVQGIINGIKSKINEVAQWGARLAKAALDAAKEAVGIHSPSRAFQDEVGAMMVAGLASGIKKHAKDAEKEASDMSKDCVEVAKEWIDERKYYNKISLEEEYYVWQQIQNEYAAGSEESIKVEKEVYRVKNELRKQEFDNFNKDLENRKYYNQLSKKEEFIQLFMMRSEFEQDTDERIKIDRELYRLKNELYKEDYDNAVKSINDRKYYNQLTLGQELQSWQELQQKYAEGTEEREKIDREAYRLQQEITKKRKSLEDDYYSKTKSINDKLQQDTKSLYDQYDSALKSRTDSLYKAYGLFDRVTINKPISGKQLTFNLENQMKDIDNWQKNLNDLSSKGVSDEFITELKDMGIQSKTQIEALAKMSKPELDKYTFLWREKHAQAKNQSLKELDSLRQQTTLKIVALQNQANIDLSNLRAVWSDQMSLLVSNSEEHLTKLNATFNTEMEILTSTTTKKFTSMSETIQNIDWIGVGNNIVNGMITGIQQKAGDLAMIAAQTALMALEAAKEALGINSPSKEFAKLGMYADEGLAMGLSKYSGLVESSSTSIGDAAINSLRDSLSNMMNIINGDIDSTPVIRPVIDLTDVNAGTKLINGMFSSTRGLSVGSINNKIPNVKTKMNSEDSVKQNESSTKTQSIQFVQNNYSPKELSRIDIYRQTRNQISALKGLVMDQ